MRLFRLNSLSTLTSFLVCFARRWRNGRALIRLRPLRERCRLGSRLLSCCWLLRGLGGLRSLNRLSGLRRLLHGSCLRDVRCEISITVHER